MIHVEQVAVAFGNLGFAQALDRGREIQINPEPAFADAPAFIADLFGSPGRNITRGEIPVARIFTLEVVITVAFRNSTGSSFVARLLGNPNPTVIPKRFAHQSEFALGFSADGNTGGMNLCVAGVGKTGTLFVGAPNGGRVRTLGVG